MNYAFARDQYRKSKNAALSSLSDPHEMIGLTLKELTRSLNSLQNDNLTEEQRNLHLSKGFTAVYILQTSLDFDKGLKLRATYSKFTNLFASNYKRPSKETQQQIWLYVRGILDEIIDAWSNIK